MTEQRTIQGEQGLLTYELEWKQVKNLNLRIRRNGVVMVSANPLIPVERIDAFVLSKQAFIVSARETFTALNAYQPQPKQYVSGESFSILGRDVRLKVLQANRESVTCDGVFLFLSVKDMSDYERKKRLVTGYLDKQCKEVFGALLLERYPTFQKYGVAFPTLRMRTMDTRWGSCIPAKGVITLNKRLLSAPRSCIEYVVLHEYCHFIHPNHSKDFYLFLTMLMPDWKERKAELEKYAVWG